MLGINLKHSLATVAVAAGLLVAAGSASAGTHESGVVSPNGHAGLGAPVYQQDQTDLEFLAFSPRGPGFTSEDSAADGVGADYILMADMGGQFYSRAAQMAA